MENNVVLCQSGDGLVRMETIVDVSSETIWATQKAMAQLFGETVSAVSRHLKNTNSEEELKRHLIPDESRAISLSLTDM